MTLPSSRKLGRWLAYLATAALLILTFSDLDYQSMARDLKTPTAAHAAADTTPVR